MTKYKISNLGKSTPRHLLLQDREVAAQLLTKNDLLYLTLIISQFVDRYTVVVDEEDVSNEGIIESQSNAIYIDNKTQKDR